MVNYDGESKSHGQTPRTTDQLCERPVNLLLFALYGTKTEYANAQVLNLPIVPMR